MTAEDMEKIQKFYEEQKAGGFKNEKNVYDKMWETKCRLFSAIAKTGWTLWTRYRIFHFGTCKGADVN